jgi:hypothetical protein
MKLSAMAVATSVALASLGIGPAIAASKETEEIQKQVRALGKRWDGEVLQKTAPLYVPPLQKVSRQGIAVEKEISFGADEKQRLDI